ncbi:MAG: acyltransferase, partial [Mycobacterium sp.]
MFIGGGSEHDSLRVGNAYDWDPGSGTVVTWQPTPGCIAKAAQAPVSPVPPSSMQAGHLRGFVEFRERGLDYSRAVMGSWDVPGKCDIRAMTYVINAHIRRHATYHSWFEY